LDANFDLNKRQEDTVGHIHIYQHGTSLLM